MKKQKNLHLLNYRLNELKVIGLIPILILSIALYIYLKHFITGEMYIIGDQKTLLIFFCSGVILASIVVFNLYLEKEKLFNMRTEDSIQNYTDLVDKKCIVVAVEKYIKHYKLYFDCENKIYIICIFLHKKELNNDEKILLRTKHFSFSYNNEDEVIIEPKHDNAHEPGHTYYKVFHMEEKQTNGKLREPETEFI